MTNVEILYKDAFEEGERQATYLAEQIKDFKKLCPSGYELVVKNNELAIFSPYNITSTGRWTEKRLGTRIGSYTKIEDLTETGLKELKEEIKVELQRFELKVKENEKKLGYEQKKNVLEVEEDIAQQTRVIEILVDVNLSDQLKEDLVKLNFLHKKKAVLVAGYKSQNYDKKYDIRNLDTCPIPLYALEKFRKAHEQKLFDSFELWITGDGELDPILLIGIIETKKYRLGCLIAEFDYEEKRNLMVTKDLVKVEMAKIDMNKEK